MVDLSTKTVLVADHGLFLEQAARLARDFAKVYYWTPYHSASTQSTPALVGTDYDGLERVLEFDKYIDEVDLIVFFDTGFGEQAHYLRQHGYRVFGSGRAEWLELDRWRARKWQHEALGPELTQRTTHLVGIDGPKGLRNYLQDVQDKVVKLSTFRGDMETFKHRDWELSEDIVKRLDFKLGPKADTMEFMVEDVVEGIEPGIDWLFAGGEFCNTGGWGYELKDSCYLQRTCRYEEIPDPLKKIANAMTDELAEEANSFVSAEAIVTKEGKGFLIDPTIRCAGPVVAGLQTELWENYSELIWLAAGGEICDPIVTAPYAGGVGMYTEYTQEGWTPLQFPKEMKPWVKLAVAYRKNGQYLLAPMRGARIDVIALGDSPEEVVERIKERAKEIHAHQLADTSSALDELMETIDEGERDYGLNFKGA